MVLYAGPGRGWVRGFAGDIVVVPFLVHLIGLALPRHHVARIVGVGVLALGTELLQLAHLVGPDAPTWLHLTLGSTFDPWDLVGYALGMGAGAGTAALVERVVQQR